jgi:hypothetical protein
MPNMTFFFRNMSIPYIEGARHAQHAARHHRADFRTLAVSLWRPISARTPKAYSDWAGFVLDIVPAELNDHEIQSQRTLQSLHSNGKTDRPLKESSKTTNCINVLRNSPEAPSIVGSSVTRRRICVHRLRQLRARLQIATASEPRQSSLTL